MAQAALDGIYIVAAGGAATFSAHIANTMVDEPSVNAVWCSILATYYFKYPRYVIAPEYRIVAGAKKYRSDLVVKDLQNGGKAVFVFEGKEGGGQSATFDAARAQVGKYMDSLQVKWGMMAIGQKVCFLVTDGSDTKYLNADLKPVPANPSNVLDITQNASTIAQILGLLTVRINNPDLPA